MSEQQVDTGRRRFLTIASSAVGGVAVVGAATPFFMSFFPSERAKAAGAPVEVDIGKIEAGQKINVEWRGKPVWILSRTPEQIKNLPKNDPKLVDPQSEVEQQPKYCQNEHRSIKPQFLVAVGICTHLAVRRPSGPTWRPPTWGRTGWEASTAPATVPSSTWPPACSRGCRRRRTWKSPRTSICPIPAC